MLFFDFVVDTRVIEVNHDKFTNTRPKYLIHKPHKSTWSIEPFESHFIIQAWRNTSKVKAHPYYPHTTQKEVKRVKEVQIL